MKRFLMLKRFTTTCTTGGGWGQHFRRPMRGMWHPKMLLLLRHMQVFVTEPPTSLKVLEVDSGLM